MGRLNNEMRVKFISNSMELSAPRKNRQTQLDTKLIRFDVYNNSMQNCRV